MAAMSHGVEGQAAPTEIDAELAATVADVMQALATPSRVRILGELRGEARSVGVLATAVGMEGSAVSHQLRVLRHLGLVTRVRDGRHIIYTLHDDHVAALLDQAVFHVEHLRIGAARPVVGAAAS